MNDLGDEQAPNSYKASSKRSCHAQMLECKRIVAAQEETSS